MEPAVASLLVVIASAVVAPLLLKMRAPLFAVQDLLWYAAGLGVMVAAAWTQLAPASAWSPVVDLGSFAVGTSLVVTNPPGSWPRRVGALILGIHAAQVLFTNTNSLYGSG